MYGYPLIIGGKGKIADPFLIKTKDPNETRKEIKKDKKDKKGQKPMNIKDLLEGYSLKRRTK